MNKRLARISLLLLSLAACGTGDSGANDKGFTACGDFPDQEPKTCNPGQYCEDEIFSECALGCLGNYNCEEGSECRKAPGEDVGVCDGAAPAPDGGTPSSPDGGPTGNALEACLNACSILTGCGAIDVGEGAQCNSDCNGLSDGQRQAVADCVGDWNCSGDIPPCLGLECGPAYDCPVSGQDCLGGICL